MDGWGGWNAAALPLEKAVLYTSGVGFFRHAGEVTDDASVEMKFAAGAQAAQKSLERELLAVTLE